MKELIRQYLDNDMSRRQLMTGLSALGMSTVLIHPMSGVLSAYGMGLADLRVMRERAFAKRSLEREQMLAATRGLSLLAQLRAWLARRS